MEMEHLTIFSMKSGHWNQKHRCSKPRGRLWEALVLMLMHSSPRTTKLRAEAVAFGLGVSRQCGLRSQRFKSTVRLSMHFVKVAS